MKIVVDKGTQGEHAIQPGKYRIRASTTALLWDFMFQTTLKYLFFAYVIGKLFHYTPGRNRETLHKLEMDLTIPAKSTATLTFTVEKGYLKWDEYPPDANHGFYLESSHFELKYPSKITAKTENANSNSTDQPTQTQRIHYYFTRKLLVDLSTPDFSMPYNVICLTCTVVALAFGPIHNITTRRLCLVPVVSTKDKLKRMANKLLRRQVFSIKEQEQAQTESEVKEPEAEATNEDDAAPNHPGNSSPEKT